MIFVIHKLKINNYKLFDDFSLFLSEGINLICGQNGSGKSSIFEIVHAIVRFLAMPEFSSHVAWSVEEAFPFSSFSRWRTQKSGFGDMSISMEASNSDGVNFIYELAVRYNFLNGKARVQNESLKIGEEPEPLLSFAEGDIQMRTDDDKKLSFKSDWGSSGLVTGSRNNSKIRLFGELISRLYPLHLVPSLMKQDFEKDSQTLSMNGENFPAWRFHCSNSQSEKQVWATSQCKNFIPGLVGINNVKKGEWYGLSLRVNHKGNNYDLAFGELSDGQKTLVALYSILANVPNGSTVFIDEPENFLAPSELQPWLNSMNDAWEDRDIQFIVASHNSETINWHSKEAIIFSVEESPPRIAAHRHMNDIGTDTLIDKLRSADWEAV